MAEAVNIPAETTNILSDNKLKVKEKYPLGIKIPVTLTAAIVILSLWLNTRHQLLYPDRFNSFINIISFSCCLWYAYYVRDKIEKKIKVGDTNLIIWIFPILCAITNTYSYLNFTLDTSPPETYYLTVHSKYITTDRHGGNSYHVLLNPIIAGEPLIHMSESGNRFDNIKEGNKAKYVIHQGYYGRRWIEKSTLYFNNLW